MSALGQKIFDFTHIQDCTYFKENHIASIKVYCKYQQN